MDIIMTDNRAKNKYYVNVSTFSNFESISKTAVFSSLIITWYIGKISTGKSKQIPLSNHRSHCD